MRRLTPAVAVVLACGAVPYAGADPLGPPVHRLTVWRLERTRPSAPPLRLTIRYTPTDDWGAIVVAGYRREGRRQRLVDAADTFYVETRRGGVYPSVVLAGQQQVPACPAAVLCSSPAVPGDWAELQYRPKAAGLDYYLFVKDTDVAITLAEGWRRREVPGGTLHQLRETGTSARVSAHNRQYMVEDFHGVEAPRVKRPSVAFATIPCWIYPLPGGSGEAVLTNDGRTAGSSRRMDCDHYFWGALGASNVATTWRNEGASSGWSGGAVMRLVVAELPPL